MKLKVLKCAEFDCPFWHGGTMGSETCQLLPKDKVWESKYDLNGNGGVAPKWCPLKKENVEVSFGE